MIRGLRARTWLTLCGVAALALVCTAAALAGRSASAVVITCSACQSSATDPFLQFNYQAAQRFNARYKGRYEIKMVQNQYAGSGPNRRQYYQRLALANALPDLFLLQRSELQTLAGTQKLHDFAPALRSDPKWRQTFYPESFAALTDPKGHVYAIPEERDSIGI